MLSSVLIANRGEIACRIIRTAKDLGMRTIAVFSDADRDAQHVKLADEAYHIGGAAANESYLRDDIILGIARQAEAACIHPGYGFLSENAEFAQACEAAGIVFVGPPADAIRAMGLKDAAKRLMEAANVPVVPGYHGENQDPEFLAAQALRIGYPVLIKAVAGGGGKGMRQVGSASEFPKALKAAKREAGAAFKEERVLIEKYVSCPRHIEIQIFADGHGNVVHLFERDCSLQRRHQKVIEEAPAPDMPAKVREAMGRAAVDAAKAISYQGAGTVEFIVDASDGLKPDGFYFMEMNTRLQVEHPVTEMITGEDLVEWQFLVAAGEEMPLKQEDVMIAGHAVEARIYAEDPNRKFFPSTGTLHRLRLPEEDLHVRVDTGVAEGDTVSMFYDPMIAKVICWGQTRDQALRRLRAALQSTQIAGLRSNVAFLAQITASPAFCAGEISTGFIDTHLADLVRKSGPPPMHVVGLAALYEILRRDVVRACERVCSNDIHSPWTASDGWQLGGARQDALSLLCNGTDRLEIGVRAVGIGWNVSLGSETVPAEGALDESGNLEGTVSGTRYRAGVIEMDGCFALMTDGITYEFGRYDPLDLDIDDMSSGIGVVSPMPGKIVQVHVGPGARVRKGDPLIVLEAMKLEQTIQATKDAVVAVVHVQAGDQVDGGAILVAFEEEKD